jgi:hypothetical protein
VVVLFSSASPARADGPSAADLESARELYKEGKVLRDKGDLKGALDRFKQANAYGHTPVTALELGRTHMELGELVEAREVFLSVGRMKVESDETEKSASARTEAANLAEQVRGKIGTLDIRLTGVAAGVEPDVSVDGAAIPLVSFHAIRKTNPGPHTIVAKAGTREERRTLDLREGESKDVAIALDGAGSLPGSTSSGGTDPNAGKPVSDKAPHPPETHRSISVVTWIGVGLAVVGAGAGTVTGIIALGDASTAKNQCTGKVCPTSAKSSFDSGQTPATISTISFIAAGAGVALAAVGYFVLSPHTQAAGPSVRVWASLDSVGLDGRF